MVADVEYAGPPLAEPPLAGSPNEPPFAELPLDSAGMRLRHAREALGKSLNDIAAATKIPERLLAAIEASQFSALPSRIYAIGFSRSYARVVGLDEVAIADEVRAELDGPRGDESPSTPAFIPGDPARVPGRRLTVIAGLGAVAVIVGALVYWHNAYDPEGPLPSILPTDAPPAGKSVAGARSAGLGKVAMSPAVAPVSGGPVTISALAPGIWVKVYEAAGKTLFEGQMAQGQSFTVPADASAPLIWTGRPDALAITVGGKPVARLAEKQEIVKAVPITAAALLARPQPAASAPAAPANVPAATAVSTVPQ